MRLSGTLQIAGALVGALLLASGCASSGAAPATVATLTVARLAPAQVPSPPPGSSAAISEAWNAVRAPSLLEAIAAVGRVPPADASSAHGSALVGFLALRRGDLRASQDAFGTALAASPALAEAAYGMGLVAQREDRLDLARQWYRTALDADAGLTRAAVAMRSIDLDGVNLLLSQAEAAAKAGRTDVAVSTYRDAIALAPDIEGPYIHLALLYEEGGDAAAAIATLEQGLRSAGERPGTLEQLAGLYQRAGRVAEASDAYERLSAALPGDERVAALAVTARRLYETESLPAEYRELAAKAEISREELAAILALNLRGLEELMGEPRGVIIVDSGNGWSAPFIERMVEWGVLDVYQNAFMPRMAVRRSMLVEACYRVLEIVGAAESAPRPHLDEPPPEHFLYRQTQAVIGTGLMQQRDGSFDLLGAVSGAEALDTIERLAVIVRRATD